MVPILSTTLHFLLLAFAYSSKKHHKPFKSTLVRSTSLVALHQNNGNVKESATDIQYQYINRYAAFTERLCSRPIQFAL